MIRGVVFFCSLFLAAMLVSDPALPQTDTPTVEDFKIQPLYRAAKLTWKMKDDLKGLTAVQIWRSDTFAEGPFKEIGVVTLVPGKSAYEYVDKTMGTEAKYYYKLIIKETDESFGPIPTRPYFSPPATHRLPPELKG